MPPPHITLPPVYIYICKPRKVQGCYCNGNCAFSGDFTADAFGENAELIATYDDEDYKPYLEGII